MTLTRLEYNRQTVANDTRFVSRTVPSGFEKKRNLETIDVNARAIATTYVNASSRLYVEALSYRRAYAAFRVIMLR